MSREPRHPGPSASVAAGCLFLALFIVFAGGAPPYPTIVGAWLRPWAGRAHVSHHWYDFILWHAPDGTQVCEPIESDAAQALIASTSVPSQTIQILFTHSSRPSGFIAHTSESRRPPTAHDWHSLAQVPITEEHIREVLAAASREGQTSVTELARIEAALRMTGPETRTLCLGWVLTALFFVALPAAPVFAWRGVVLAKRRRRWLDGRCPACGYKLDALTTGLCPECGNELPAPDHAT